MNLRAARQTLVLLLLVCLRVPAPLLRPAVSPAAHREVIRLKATASLWLADTTPQERNSSAGQFAIFKLKSIQEMAAIRFDAQPVKGKEVISARLFLHKAGGNMLRYLRVSTVSQDWEAGASGRPYGPADGATYLWADANHRRAWSYPGSEFADVVMGMGHSITTYAEYRQEAGDWISVELTPELVYALAAGNTDGLAVMDGGNLAYFNNYIDSAHAGNNAPYIEVEAGSALDTTPAQPKVTAEPAPANAHMGSGAIKIAVEPAPDAFCWQLKIDGQPVPRWQVPYPPAVARTGREQDQIQSGRTPHRGPVVFYLDTLEPAQSHNLEVVAVARGGAMSSPARLTLPASPALPDSLQIGPLVQPRGSAAPVRGGTRFAVWPAPGLIKINPERGGSMFRDMAGDGRGTSPNAVWDGQAIQLFGGRGEYVSYQLVIDRVDATRPLTNVTVAIGDLKGPAGAIGGGDLELFKNWYARNSAGQWQPAYCVPWAGGRSFDIPDRQRGMANQGSQSMYIDVYIPKRAGPGTYTGAVTVDAGGDKAVLPIELRVYDFALPDTLSFYAELNAYSVPANLLDYHRLAHQQRLVFNPWVVRPALQGAGKDVQVRWDLYDASVGPLLSGEAFEGNRRAGVPTPLMYLPFEDSWPTPLGRQNYDYKGHWPGKGESPQSLVEHYLTAPYIGDGLSQDYKDAFLAVQKQFVEHFKDKGWNQTEMQCFYGGKNTPPPRLRFATCGGPPTSPTTGMTGSRCSSSAVCGRKAARSGRRSRVRSIRADLSARCGRTTCSIRSSTPSTGAGSRIARLVSPCGVAVGEHGPRGAGSTAASTPTPRAIRRRSRPSCRCGRTARMASCRGRPWGTTPRWTRMTTSRGNTLMVPGTRFGVPVVGDMRLKALRDGEQIIEYLVILADRYQLQREQVGAMLAKALPLSAGRVAGAAHDDADAARFGNLQDWQIAGLRRALAELITSARR